MANDSDADAPYRGTGFSLHNKDRGPATAEMIEECLSSILSDEAAVASSEQQYSYDRLIFEMIERPHDNPLRFRYEHIVKILATVKEIFKSESSLIECPPPIHVFGDLHGCWQDLRINYRSLAAAPPEELQAGPEWYLPAHRACPFLFLGNYVGHGDKSLEVLMLLFSMKISQRYGDRQVYMLRGSHETREINYCNGFRAELLTRFDKWMADDLFEKFNDVFNHMPLACLIGGTWLCMHGGISPKLTSLDDIRRIPKPLDRVDKNKLACDLLWADFKEGLTGFEPNEGRKISVCFGKEALATTLDRLGVNGLIRGHQKVQKGRKKQGRSITITSFRDLRKKNDAAFIHIDLDLTLFVSLLPAGFNPADADFHNVNNAKTIDEWLQKTREEEQKEQPADENNERGDFVIDFGAE